jgi:hypothetical protein
LFFVPAFYIVQQAGFVFGGNDFTFAFQCGHLYLQQSFGSLVATHHRDLR